MKNFKKVAAGAVGVLVSRAAVALSSGTAGVLSSGAVEVLVSGVARVLMSGAARVLMSGAAGMLLAAFVGVNVLSSCAERQEAGMGYLSLSFDSSLLRAVEDMAEDAAEDMEDAAANAVGDREVAEATMAEAGELETRITAEAAMAKADELEAGTAERTATKETGGRTKDATEDMAKDVAETEARATKVRTKVTMAVRAARMTGLPDTNDFILTVNNPDGSVAYSGAYGKAPERIRVKAGSCNVSVRSAAFEKAAFNAPLFGDDRCVVVPAEGAVKVKLNCTQLNCGIRLKIDSRFLTAYPSAVLFVASGRDRLMYSYSERRIAYFKPGNVSVILNDNDKETTLLTRALGANEILCLNLEVGSSPSGESEAADGISIQLDTARIWGNEDFVIGSEDNKGESPDKALSVSQAKAKIGAEAVWVKGYIVGGDLSKAEEGISFEPPFKSDTHLALAARATVLSKSSCIAVQLPAGEIRDALNLSDNEELLGKVVYLKGDITESYFGLTGLKNVSDFRF